MIRLIVFRLGWKNHEWKGVGNARRAEDTTFLEWLSTRDRSNYELASLRSSLSTLSTKRSLSPLMQFWKS